jgi:hypothetical protein
MAVTATTTAATAVAAAATTTTTTTTTTAAITTTTTNTTTPRVRACVREASCLRVCVPALQGCLKQNRARTNATHPQLSA